MDDDELTRIRQQHERRMRPGVRTRFVPPEIESDIASLLGALDRARTSLAASIELRKMAEESHAHMVRERAPIGGWMMTLAWVGCASVESRWA